MSKTFLLLLQVTLSFWSLGDVMLALVVLLLGLCTVTFQVPMECAQNATRNGIRECCPMVYGSQCGVRFGWGECRNVNESMKNATKSTDDKWSWPYNMYDRMCVCKGNFYRYNCAYCAPGWNGTNCSQAISYPRRPIMAYSPIQLNKFLAQLQFCKDLHSPEYVIMTNTDRTRPGNIVFKNCSYLDYAVFVHYLPSTATYMNGVFSYQYNYAHFSCGFPTWHREYLFFIEHLMQVCLSDYSFRLPYYYWAQYSGCPMCNNNYFGGNYPNGTLNEASVFSTWTCPCSENNNAREYCTMPDNVCARSRLTRLPGAQTTQTPTQQQVDNVLRQRYYDTQPFDPSSNESFRCCLEGFKCLDGFTNGLCMHNLYHVYCGGTLNNLLTSSCDPVFLLHHAAVDYVFELYIRRWGLTPAHYPDCRVPGHGPKEPIMPFIACYDQSRLIRQSDTLGAPYEPPT